MTHRVFKSHRSKINNIYVIMETYILLCSSCLCEIWAFCVSWITYDHLYYALCFACWEFFGPLVPAMCNRTSCAQVHELPQSHCGNNRGAHCINTNQIIIYIIKLFPSVIKCSISCKVEWFNWTMVKIQLSFKYSEFQVNYLTIFSLITTLSTDVTKSFQCKGIFLNNVTWRHAWR